MRVLYVCSGNSQISNREFIFEIDQSFINEQVKAIEKLGIETDLFLIRGHGFKGYWKSYFELVKVLKKKSYNIIHAHNGLAALLCNFQRKVPVISTFHGSDINNRITNLISSIANILSFVSIFVEKKLAAKILIKRKRNKTYIIPCGIDLDIFYEIKKEEARSKMNLDMTNKFVLFSAAFVNPVKNYTLAKNAIELIKKKDLKLIELVNYSRYEVNLLLNAADAALMTSFSEGSPQFIKEAMAVGCPIVSTPVGDVEEIIKDVPGCYITNFDAIDVSDKILKALEFNNKTLGRNKIKHFDNANIARTIVKIYGSVNS